MQRAVRHAVGIIAQRACRTGHPSVELKREPVANGMGVHAGDLGIGPLRGNRQGARHCRDSGTSCSPVRRRRYCRQVTTRDRRPELATRRGCAGRSDRTPCSPMRRIPDETRARWKRAPETAIRCPLTADMRATWPHSDRSRYGKTAPRRRRSTAPGTPPVALRNRHRRAPRCRMHTSRARSPTGSQDGCRSGFAAPLPGGRLPQCPPARARRDPPRFAGPRP